MHRLSARRMLLLLAIWLLSGGLAFADSFDLTDELGQALFDRTCVLESDVDEVRESVDDDLPTFVIRTPDVTLRRARSAPPASSALSVLALMRPLPEILQTFRI